MKHKILDSVRTLDILKADLGLIEKPREDCKKSKEIE